MRSRHYAKEIGMSNEVRPVPKAVTAVVLLAVVALALLFARQVNSLKKEVAAATKAPAPVMVSSR